MVQRDGTAVANVEGAGSRMPKTDPEPETDTAPAAPEEYRMKQPVEQVTVPQLATTSVPLPP